jgi:hypothetical protein
MPRSSFVLTGYLKPIWRQSGEVNLANLAESPIWPIWQMNFWPTWQNYDGATKSSYFRSGKGIQSGIRSTAFVINVYFSIWHFCQSGNLAAPPIWHASINLATPSIWQSGDFHNLAANLANFSFWPGRKKRTAPIWQSRRSGNLVSQQHG